MKFAQLRPIFLCFLLTISLVKSEDDDDYVKEAFLKAIVQDERRCAATAGELVFVLDASTSVGPDDFTKEKEFATKIVDRLGVGSNLTRVALITYNSFPSLVFNLNQYNKSGEINQQIMKAPFAEGITVVGDALDKVLKEIEPKTRPKLGKVIVLISDGKANGGMDPFLVAKQLKAINYTIITIGLDKDSDEAAMKAIASNTKLYHTIKNYDALDQIVTDIVAHSCITFHLAKCPQEESKKEACINGKQTVQVTAYFEQNGKCIPEYRKLSINCLNPNECPKQYYSVARCSKNANTTQLLNVTYVRSSGQCAQQVFKLKEVACGCASEVQEKVNVIIGKDCVNGLKSQILVYNEFRQMKCQQSFFTLASLKCEALCQGKQFVTGTCVAGNRTNKVFVKKFVNNKCELVLEKSQTSKCVTSCPKSVKIMSKLCINKTRAVTLVSFQNVNMNCIQVTKKLDPVNCTEGECPPPRMRKSRCVKNRQMVSRVQYARVGTVCKMSVVKVGLVQCPSKRCQNSTYSVDKCDKSAKSTFLMKTYFESSNGTCTKKSKKVKEVSCKCYQTSNANITVTIGKTCENGFRSNVLVLQEERQGKCVDVKFTLRRVRCIKRCLSRRYTVTKCKDKKREVVKETGKLVNGKCEWKVEKKRVLDCNEICPKPTNKTTRCILGKQALLQVTFKAEGAKCVGKVLRLKIQKCSAVKRCQNSTYSVDKCDKNAKSTFLVKTFYETSNGVCTKKTKKVKEVACKCYGTAKANITVTIGKTCDKGFRSRELVLQEERQGKCVDVKFTLRRVRCIKRCLSRRYTVTKCKDKKREVVKETGKLVNGKCEWKVEKKRVLDCNEICPKPRNKTTRCILGRQALLQVTFREEGAKCVGKVLRLKVQKCGPVKGCLNSTYSVDKCDKNAKSTFLVKTYYESSNGACTKKTKKVKEVSCKCYQTSKANITVTIGKTCDKGYRSNVLVLQEERQGKCVDVKFALRRVRCIKRCLSRRYRVTKCKDKKREVVKETGKLVNGKCEWKVEKKRVLDCNKICPKPTNKTTRCILGMQALLQVTFREEGAKCVGKVLRLKVRKCSTTKKCLRSIYSVAKCEKNAKATFLLKTYYRFVNGTCVKKTKNVKEVSCKCYETDKRNITVTVGKTCQLGFRSRELIISEERQGKCVDVKFTLRRIRCTKRCLRRRYKVTKCKDKKREVVRENGRLVNGKCEWKVANKKVMNCTEPCPKPMIKESRCFRQRKVSLQVTFKEEGNNCRASVKVLKVVKCGGNLKCKNSTYEVAKCEKDAKTTPLVETYYQSSNGTCVTKTRKVKDLPCKCYQISKNNITVTLGQACEKGYRSEELVLQEERQGKCVDVKYTLRRIKCIKRCLKREYRVTKCKDKKREVSKFHEELVNGICEWKLVNKSVVPCATPCPATKTASTRCVLGKRSLIRITFKELAGSCKASVVRLKLIKCAQKCGNTTFEVDKCGKDQVDTSLIAVYFRKVNGACLKKIKKIKTVACKCYANRSRDVSVTVGKACDKGYHTREVVLHEQRQGQCVDVKFKLRRIKCIVRCLKREYKITACANKKREISRFKETLENGKCAWKLVDKRVVDCKNPCPEPKQKTSRCILGKQALFQITFKQAADRCLTTVVRLKMLTCNNTKVCTRSRYHVEKCDKSAKTTFLIRTAFENKNGTCVKKVQKLRELPCKCYEVVRANLTITVGKECTNGFKSRDLIIYEERQGKCVDVKVALRRIRCQPECTGTRTIPGPCKNQKRVVKSYENTLRNGTCIWKFIRESTANCSSACPQPKTSETPCLFGKKALIRTTYTLLGKSCIPKVERLKVLDCKSCRQRTMYKVENCTKGSASSNLVKITFKDCKQTVQVLRKVDCSCYQLNKNDLKISTASACLNGTRSRIVYYHDKGKTNCEEMKLTIGNLKCGCYGTNMTMSVCKNGNRTLTFYKKQLTNGKCNLVKVSTRSMQCKSFCPDKMVKNSKCIRNRKYEASNEYRQVGDLCVVVNYHIKWSNCNITTISTKTCSKKVDLDLSPCVKGNASVIARREVKKDDKCMKESKRIATVDCTEKCERTLRPNLVAGRCENNVKLMFYISTRSQDQKCLNNVTYLGKIKCKDC